MMIGLQMGTDTLERNLAISTEFEAIYISYIPANLLSGSQLREILAHIHKELYTRMFTASLLIRSKRNLKAH